jgi:excinuclease ABC subunit A
LATKYIELTGVRQNNLKNIDVKIPIGAFTVICGPSGSGKSSLAFETLYAEGQRRYIESLSNYARQFLGKAPKPDLDTIKNIPPAIALEQKNSVKNSRSTVGTATEVTDYLRLLFEKVGRVHCPTYDFVVARDSVTQATEKVMAESEGERGYILAPVLATGRIPDRAQLAKLMQMEGFKRIYIAAEFLPAENEGAGKKNAAGAAKTSGKRASRASADAVDASVASSSLDSSAKSSAAKSKAVGAASLKTKSKAAELTSSAVKSSNIGAPSGAKGAPPCKSPTSTEVLGEIRDLDFDMKGDISKQLPDHDFYIVVDRAQFSSGERGRVFDSIGQAYAATLKFNIGLAGGRCKVILTNGRFFSFSEDTSCATCGFSFPQVSAQLFSSSTPVGACAACNGFGNTLTLDEQKLIPNPELSIKAGAIHPLTMPSSEADRRLLLVFCKSAGIDIDCPWNKLSKAQRDLVFNGSGKWYGVVGFFDYLETKKYKMHVRVFLSRYKSPLVCTVCHGSRLRAEANYVKVANYTFGQLLKMTIGGLFKTVGELSLGKMDQDASKDVLEQLQSRLRYLNEVGLEYLTLDRPTRTLSGGEYQRMNLAKQLGMGLTQTLYVLDEPTIGLHPRDNDRLIGILQQLKELGNTLVVVEHDHDVIARSENLIELGPGSGHLGGEIVFSGDTKDFANCKASLTAPYLQKQRDLVSGHKPRPVDKAELKYALRFKNCSGHNLKNVDLTLPINRLVTITGVSGSGKSSLISQTVYPLVAQKLKVEYLPALDCEAATGIEQLTNVVMMNQRSLGRTARSNPVTYIKIYDIIRTLMAGTTESKVRGYLPGTFSLNVDGGRCPVCKGLGYEMVDMVFMDDVLIPCDACDGRKFRKEILEVTFKGKNIDQILNMTVLEAMDFFISHPNIRKPLSFLKEVGLEYIKLGQPSSTLSGGESQRLKIAREFTETQQKGTLYILDEPTTGLHFREVDLLIGVLNRLVDAGASVVVIEHNLDVIRNSDYIIDLGPDAGARGGEIVAEGTPDQIMKSKASLTGKYLEEYINRSNSLSFNKAPQIPNQISTQRSGQKSTEGHK